jgi:hypothetical protein
MNYVEIGIITFIIIFLIVYKKNTEKNDISKKDNIKTLVRQASRYSIASQQDKSPLIALLHANYGAGYLWALKDIASEKEIYNATKINLLRFEKKITDIQDNATKRVSRLCPQFIGSSDIELLKLAGDV